jgi:hypothetical protein
MELPSFPLGVIMSSMLHKKAAKQPGNVRLASVSKEMAKPRTARSARIAELNLDAGRIREQPSATMRGTVEKIIRSARPRQPEEAQIAVEGSDHRHRDLRIENTLTNENGDDVRLKKGAQVEVTVTAAPNQIRRSREEVSPRHSR